MPRIFALINSRLRDHAEGTADDSAAGFEQYGPEARDRLDRLLACIEEWLLPPAQAARLFVAPEAETALDRMAASAKAERVFLRLLALFGEQSRDVNANGGTNYAPKVFAEYPDAEGVSRRGFKGAMETLLRRGKVEVRHRGPASRRVSCLAETGKEPC